MSKSKTQNVLPAFTVYIHGRQWYVRFSYDGRQYIKRVPDSRDCEEEEARSQAASVVQGIVGQLERAKDHRRQQNPLKAYQDRAQGKSAALLENTQRYKERFIEFFGDRDLATIVRFDVIAWRDWLLKQKKKGTHKGLLSPKSVKEHIDWLATVYNHSGLNNPCRGVERPRISERERQERVEFFTPDEVRAMFEKVRGTRFENAFTFLAYTGCRRAELQGIRPEDCEASTRIVYLVGKGDTRRPLKLTGPCAPAWNALVAEMEHGLHDGYIFPQGSSWVGDSMHLLGGNVWGWQMRDTGRKGKDGQPLSVKDKPIRSCHPHMMRHTFASMALLYFNPPWPIAVLSKWLGHRDINTTFKLYSHWIAAEAPSSWESVEGSVGMRFYGTN